jgi:hypothetical protein
MSRKKLAIWKLTTSSGTIKQYTHKSYARSDLPKALLDRRRGAVVTRIVFISIALALVLAGLWAYHHDQKLGENASQVTIGDPNEIVRQLLGDPSREGSCGALTPTPKECTDEYVYRYWYSIFQPKYEVIWFDHAGKVLGEQHVQSQF